MGSQKVYPENFTLSILPANLKRGSNVLYIKVFDFPRELNLFREKCHVTKVVSFGIFYRLSLIYYSNSAYFGMKKEKIPLFKITRFLAALRAIT